MKKQYKLGVRVVSRFGRSDPERGLNSPETYQQYLDQMVADGWKLMGPPQYAGIEGYLEDPNDGMRFVMFWERGE